MDSWRRKRSARNLGKHVELVMCFGTDKACMRCGFETPNIAAHAEIVLTSSQSASMSGQSQEAITALRRG